MAILRDQDNFKTQIKTVIRIAPNTAAELTKSSS